MANEYLAYIGTYTSLGAEGIYCYRFDMATGGLEYVNTTGAIDDPSFLDIAPSGKYLYAVCADFEAMTTGIIRAYSIDAATGELTLLNEQSSEGTGPCHVEVDQTSRYVLLANYGSGSVASYPIQEDGSLGKATGFVQHEGSSIDPERQQGPHGHSINIDPTNTFAFAADLGIDKVLAYRINHDDGSLTPADSPYTRTPPGGGPRHFAFHPNGRHAYLLNEMGSSVTALHYDSSRGMLNEIETLTTLPDDFDGVNHCADIHVSPDGQFVYASNRGHDSIAVFGIDQDTGGLSFVGRVSSGGETPRNFALDPSGTYMLVSNQDTGNILTYRINYDTGMPEPTGHEVDVPAPVCIKLLPV